MIFIHGSIYYIYWNFYEQFFCHWVKFIVSGHHLIFKTVCCRCCPSLLCNSHLHSFDVFVNTVMLILLNHSAIHIYSYPQDIMCWFRFICIHVFQIWEETCILAPFFFSSFLLPPVKGKLDYVSALDAVISIMIPLVVLCFIWIRWCKELNEREKRLKMAHTKQESTKNKHFSRLTQLQSINNNNYKIN